MIAQIEDFNEDCVQISLPYLLYFLRKKPSKSEGGGGGFIFRLKTLFQFFPISFKVLELSECRSGDPYMTATSITHRIKNPLRRTSEHITILHF